MASRRSGAVASAPRRCVNASVDHSGPAIAAATSASAAARCFGSQSASVVAAARFASVYSISAGARCIAVEIGGTSCRTCERDALVGIRLASTNTRIGIGERTS